MLNFLLPLTHRVIIFNDRIQFNERSFSAYIIIIIIIIFIIIIIIIIIILIIILIIIVTVSRTDFVGIKQFSALS